MAKTIHRGPTFRASGTIAPMKWVNISGVRTVAQVDSATADMPFGLSQEGQKLTPGVTGSDTDVAAASGDQVQVIGPGNVGLSKAGGTITAGDIVKPDANGDSVATGSTAATKYLNGGFALESAASGEYFEVYVFPHTTTFPA